MNTNPVNAEELFQIIGEQVITIRKLTQKLTLLQKEVIDNQQKEAHVTPDN
jgi:hypothetical protein